MSNINIIIFINFILFYLLFFSRAILLLSIQKINPFVLGKGKKGFNFFLELIFVFALLFWSYEIIILLFDLKEYQILPDLFILKLFNSKALIIWGIILLYFGIFIFLAALISFGASWRVGIDKNNPGKLVQKGIFKYTRNPIFLFINIYFFSFVLIFQNLVFFIFFAGTLIGIHYQILQEEKFLTHKYKEEYLKYFQRVRRYF